MTREEFERLVDGLAAAESNEEYRLAYNSVFAAFDAQAAALEEARRDTGPSLVTQWIDAWLLGPEPDNHTARWAAQQIRARLVTAGACDDGFVAIEYRKRLEAAESRAAEAEKALRRVGVLAEKWAATYSAQPPGEWQSDRSARLETVWGCGRDLLAALRSTETGRAPDAGGERR